MSREPAGPKEIALREMREARLAQIMKADTKKPGKVPYVGRPATGQGSDQTAGSGRPLGMKDSKPRRRRKKIAP